MDSQRKTNGGRMQNRQTANAKLAAGASKGGAGEGRGRRACPMPTRNIEPTNGTKRQIRPEKRDKMAPSEGAC